jgi:ABC-type uncharacterized transport system YnjBCD substrate-binding protein
MPMFHSQTALAYNSDLLKNPPKSYDELKAWVKAHPKQFGYNGIKINAVGTGPGEPGSRAIVNKIKSQKDAGVAKWDVDVAIVHQIVMPDLVQSGLVAKYTPEISTSKLMTAADGKNALGFNVDGYVMPMFHSQVVLAYNPEFVKSPPNNFDELVTWIKANPKKFGYNGVKGGMSGVAFTTGWVYWKAGGDEKFTKARTPRTRRPRGRRRSKS